MTEVKIALDMARKANDILQSYSSSVNMINSDEQVKVTSFPDIFYPLPDEFGTNGTKIMKISNKSDPNLINLVKIPANGAVKHHYHNNLIEYVVVIKGVVYYKIYESDKYSKVVEQGVLVKGDSLSINKLKTHYIFTSKEESYLAVEFQELS